MLDTNGYIANKTVFAARNGFDGFKSIFDEVLKRDTLDRLFILKGGPGTGKSSIMKAVIKYANHTGIYATEILCSSDPNSLDGVILMDGDRRVAIVDGTAPHVLDPKYPGAFDEIINLGDSFNLDHLRKYGEKIKDLTRHKSHHYKEAYAYLNLAGSVHARMREKCAGCVDGEKLKKLLCEVLENHDISNPEAREVYYASAFCKDGYRTPSSLENKKRNVVRLFGNGHTEYIVLGELYRMLNGYIEAYCKTPLTDRYTEAIYTENFAYFVAQGDNGINTTTILTTKLELDEENGIYNNLLELARSEFSKASEYHFALEDIYRYGMNFTHNEEIYAQLLVDIEGALG